MALDGLSCAGDACSFSDCCCVRELLCRHGLRGGGNGRAGCKRAGCRYAHPPGWTMEPAAEGVGAAGSVAGSPGRRGGGNAKAGRGRRVAPPCMKFPFLSLSLRVHGDDCGAGCLCCSVVCSLTKALPCDRHVHSLSWFRCSFAAFACGSAALSQPFLHSSFAAFSRGSTALLQPFLCSLTRAVGSTARGGRAGRGCGASGWTATSAT